MMLGAMLKSEYIAISEEESQVLSDAVVRVTDLYDIQIIPEKQMAWINLFMVMGSVYGPRIGAATIAKKRKPAPQVINGAFGGFDSTTANY